MATSRKINKAKGIELVADLLHSGKIRKEILQEIAINYDCSPKTVDNWIKDARPIVKERQEQDEEVRRRESEAIVTDAVKRHGVTKERLIERLAIIAFGDVTKIFTVDGGLKPISDWDEEAKGLIAGIESFDVTQEGMVMGTNRKVKTLSPLEAIAQLARLLGYNAPDKVAETDTQGRDKKVSTHRVVIENMTNNTIQEQPGDGI